MKFFREQYRSFIDNLITLHLTYNFIYFYYKIIKLLILNKYTLYVDDYINISVEYLITFSFTVR